MKPIAFGAFLFLVALVWDVQETLAAETPAWFVRLDDNSNKFTLPEGRSACLMKGDQPGAVTKTFEARPGETLRLRLAQDDACSGASVEVTALPPAASFASAALGSPNAGVSPIIQLVAVVPVIARSEALRKYLKIGVTSGLYEAPEGEVLCRGDVCAFPIGGTPLTPKRVRLNAIIDGARTFTAKGEWAETPIPINAGEALNRWLIGSNMSWTPGSPPEATLSTNLGDPQNEAYKKGELVINEPAIEDAIPEGGASLIVDCSLAAQPGQAPQKRTGCVEVARANNTAFSYQLKIVGRHLNEFREAARNGTATISLPLSSITLVSVVSGDGASALSVRVTAAKCDYQVTQLTPAVESMGNAHVLFSVRSTPSGCGRIDGVATDPAAAATVWLQSADDTLAVARFETVPDAGKLVKLRFLVGGIEVLNHPLEISKKPSFALRQVLVPSMLVSSGRTAPSDAVKLEAAAALLGKVDKLLPAPEEKGSHPEDKLEAGSFDLLSRTMLAVKRDNWLILSLEPSDLPPTGWAFQSTSLELVPCSSDKPPVPLPPNARALCVHPTRTGNGPVTISIKLKTPWDNAVAPASFPRSDIDGGTTNLSLALAMRPHDLAVDLAQVFVLKCGDKPDLHGGAPIMAMVDANWKKCRLQFQVAEDRFALYGPQHLRFVISKRSAENERKGEGFTAVWEKAVLWDPAIPPNAANREREVFESLESVGELDVESFAQVRVTVSHEQASEYAEAAGVSFPKSTFTATVRRIPLASQWLDSVSTRFYLTFPLDIAVARYPHSGKGVEKSSDLDDTVERTDFGIGVLGVFELWDFDYNRPYWGGIFSPQVNVGVMTTLPFDFSKAEVELPGLSLVAGVAMRIPPSTGTPIESALRALIWGELPLRIPGVSNPPAAALLFGLGVNFGAILE